MTNIKRYDYAFDPDGDAWAARILRRVPPGASVLELGPGPGAMTRVLLDRGHATWVVEKDPDAVTSLRELGIPVIEADLDSNGWIDALGAHRFDAILACDVLEHLVDPEAVVQKLVDVVGQRGRLIISMPNLAYIGVLASLRKGCFDYGEKGLLDRTHVRFFTRSSLEMMLLSSGWIPIRWEANRVPVYESEFGWHWASLPDGIRNVLQADWTEADVYQWMVEAVPATEKGRYQAVVRHLRQVREEFNSLLKEHQNLKELHARERAALTEHQKAFAEAKGIIDRLTGELRDAVRQADGLRRQLDERERSGRFFNWRRWLGRRGR